MKYLTRGHCNICNGVNWSTGDLQTYCNRSKQETRHHVEGLTAELYLGLTSLGSKDSKEQRNRRPGDQLPWRCWTLTHLWFGKYRISWHIVTSDKCFWKVGVSQHQVDFQEVKPGFHSLLLHHGTSKHPFVFFFFRRRKIWLRTFGKRWNLRTNRWRPRHARCECERPGSVGIWFGCQSLVGLRNFYGAAQGNCCVSRAVWHPDAIREDGPQPSQDSLFLVSFIW